MSSDLRDLIRTDLDRIPLPPDTEWIQPRDHRRGRALRAAALALVVILVVVASLGAGQALRAVRDWVESQRVATGIVAGAFESSVVSRPPRFRRTRSALSRDCIASRITVRSDQRRSQKLRAKASGCRAAAASQRAAPASSTRIVPSAPIRFDPLPYRTGWICVCSSARIIDVIATPRE